MGERTVTLQVPDEIYNSAQEVAHAAGRSVETVLMESIDVLFRKPSLSEDIERLLNEMAHYSDTQLWAVVYRQIPWLQSLRLRELSGKNKQGLLANTEASELEQLLQLVDRYMLLRSEALLLLKQHGQDVESYWQQGA